MKKTTLISVSLILIGFVFEYFYLVGESTFFDIKFWVAGIVSILAGVIGLWLFTIIPLLDKGWNGK